MLTSAFYQDRKTWITLKLTTNKVPTLKYFPFYLYNYYDLLLREKHFQDIQGACVHVHVCSCMYVFTMYTCACYAYMCMCAHVCVHMCMCQCVRVCV